MRAPAIALVAAVAGALLVPAVPLAEDLPAGPVAALDAADGPVVAGKAVKLDSSRSTGAIADHRWDLDGDGSFETDTGAVPTAEAKPAVAGPLTVRVRVTDTAGRSDDAERVLDVAAAPADDNGAAPGMSAATGPPAGGDATADPPPEQPAPAAAPPAPAAPAAAGPGTHAPAPPEAHPPPHPAAHHHSAEPGPPRDDPHAGDPAAPAPEAAPASLPAPAATMEAAPLMRPATLYAATAHPRPVAAKPASVHAAGASAVAIRNFAFSPGQVTVHVGDTVTWTNSDSAPHTATASNGSFDTGIIKKGASGSHTFTSAGTISYVCSVHPNMHGTVVVAAASGTSGGTGSSAGSGGGSGSGDTSGSAGTPSATAAATTSGGLPHTGLNLIVVALVAVCLTGSGRLLRRIAR